MPSTTLLYSLPAQLGRRGTTALAVVALHFVLAVGLITAVVIRNPPGPTDAPTPVPPLVVPTPPGPRPPVVDGDDYVPLPPVQPIQIELDPVTDPRPVVDLPPGSAPPAAHDEERVSAVRVLRGPPPLYPAAERRLEHEGVVTLRARVNAAGHAEQVEVARSSGHSRLDDAAIAAVQGWTFAPAQTATGPVSSWVVLTVRFRLTD